MSTSLRPGGHSTFTDAASSSGPMLTWQPAGAGAVLGLAAGGHARSLPPLAPSPPETPLPHSPTPFLGSYAAPAAAGDVGALVAS
jgi:hypothetical protein